MAKVSVNWSLEQAQLVKKILIESQGLRRQVLTDTRIRNEMDAEELKEQGKQLDILNGAIQEMG